MFGDEYNKSSGRLTYFARTTKQTGQDRKVTLLIIPHVEWKLGKDYPAVYRVWPALQSKWGASQDEFRLISLALLAHLG